MIYKCKLSANIKFHQQISMTIYTTSYFFHSSLLVFYLLFELSWNWPTYFRGTFLHIDIFRFHLITQIFHFTALYSYIFIHLYKIIELSTIYDQEDMLFNQQAFYQTFGIMILPPELVLKLQEIKSVEEFILLLLWIIYPFRLMYLGF